MEMVVSCSRSPIDGIVCIKASLCILDHVSFWLCVTTRHALKDKRHRAYEKTFNMFNNALSIR